MADTPQYKQSAGLGASATNIVSPTEANVNQKPRGPVPKGPRSIKQSKTNKRNRLAQIIEGLRGAR